VLLTQPGDGDRCIQAARIGEHDLLQRQASKQDLAEE
jgi:hypothetical protein